MQENYQRIEKGNVVQYMPNQVDAIVGIGAPTVKATLSDRGIEPAVDYLVRDASEPKTHGGTTAQTILLIIDGKKVSVNSAFFTCVARARTDS